MANNPTDVPLLSLPLNLLFDIAKDLADSDIAALVATCRSLREKASELEMVNFHATHSQILSLHGLSLVTPAGAIPIGSSSHAHVHFASDLTGQHSPNSSSAAPITGQLSLSQMDNGPSSMSSSPTSSNGFDSHASSDTELTTPEEDDEWVFELTPAILRRLRKLPNRQDGAALTELPTELQCQIFSYLDKIDATCLGLTSPRTYAIYRSIHGVGMPLNTRRQGPNHLERCWEVVGKQECAQCGIYRCELYQHVKTWMPADMEYCSFKLKFGSKGEDGVAENCFRGKPSKPRRCGRHPLRTTSVHQDDSLAMQAAR